MGDTCESCGMPDNEHHELCPLYESSMADVIRQERDRLAAENAKQKALLHSYAVQNAEYESCLESDRAYVKQLQARVAELEESLAKARARFGTIGRTAGEGMQATAALIERVAELESTVAEARRLLLASAEPFDQACSKLAALERSDDA